MINRTLVTLLLIIMHFPLCGQIRLPGYQGEKVNPALYMGQWPACWISMTDEPADIYGVYHFRRLLSWIRFHSISGCMFLLTTGISCI